MIVDTLHVYWDKDGRYRWSFVSENGRTLADSGQGYRHKADALHGFAILNRTPVGPVPLYELIRCDRHDRTCQVWQIRREDLEAIRDHAATSAGRVALYEASRCAPTLVVAAWLERMSREWRR